MLHPYQNILDEIHRYDKQIVLHDDPERKRWVVLRMPDRFGYPAKEYWHGEVKARLTAANLMEIFVCQDDSGNPMSPGSWIVNYLRKRDTHNMSFRQFVREMDERNEKLVKKAKEDTTDRLEYRLKQDWPRVRDELRGDTGHRKSTYAPGNK